jgi:hypothetical protein
MGARHGDVERAAYHSRSGGLAIPRLSPLRDAGFPKRGQPSYVEGVDGTREPHFVAVPEWTGSRREVNPEPKHQ